MKPRKTILVFGASLLLNMLALPIAAPIMLDNAKQATADKLMELSQQLRPTEIPAVRIETLKKAANGHMGSMPEKLPIGKMAQVFPASDSYIIRNLLESE